MTLAPLTRSHTTTRRHASAHPPCLPRLEVQGIPRHLSPLPRRPTSVWTDVVAGVSVGKRPEWLKRHAAAARKWLLAAADAGHTEASFQLSLWADENEGRSCFARCTSPLRRAAMRPRGGAVGRASPSAGACAPLTRMHATQLGTHEPAQRARALARLLEARDAVRRHGQHGALP